MYNHNAPILKCGGKKKNKQDQSARGNSILVIAMERSERLDTSTGKRFPDFCSFY